MGTKLVTASADNTARIYSTMTGTCIGVLDGTLTYSFLNLRS
jgi:WD40 repeat protein